MSTRGARVVRGLIVAIVSLLVAAIAHIAGGGEVGGVGFALALAFSSIASIALSGRTVSVVRLTISVMFSQGIFHVLFGIGAREPSIVFAHAHMNTMAMSGQHAAPAASRIGMSDNGWMWLAHAVAAAITIAALIKGEKTFWRLAEWVVYALSRITGPVGAFNAPSILRVVPGSTRSSARALFLVAGMRHRGPPLASVLA